MKDLLNGIMKKFIKGEEMNSPALAQASSPGHERYFAFI
jgi:hypothetical protein